MAVGEDVNSGCIPVEKLIGKENLRPLVTRLQEMSVPGTGNEFEAYRSSNNDSNATRTKLSLFVIMRSPLLKYLHSHLTSIGL